MSEFDKYQKWAIQLSSSLDVISPNKLQRLLKFSLKRSNEVFEWMKEKELLTTDGIKHRVDQAALAKFRKQHNL